MIPVHLYHFAYLFFCFILIFLYKLKKTTQTGLLTVETDNSNYIKVWIIGILLILFFGLRENENDPNLFMADTTGYAKYYNEVKSKLLPTLYSISDIKQGAELKGEVAFFFIRDEMASNGWSVQAWFIVVASIYIIPKLIVIKRWFPNNTYLALLFAMTTMGFYSGGTNGIRNADASSLVILGISYFISNKHSIKNYIIGIILCIIGYYTHHSVIITITALIATLFFVRNTKFAIAIWLIAIFMSLIYGNTLANFGATLFEDERATSYLTSGQNADVMEGFAHTGFRWDFLLYSAMPILMGWYVLIKKGIKDTTYKLLVNTYILANAVWVIFIYASYNNRFAALSWALYSYILLYPLVRYDIWGKKQPRFISLILLAQLIFISIF